MSSPPIFGSSILNKNKKNLGLTLNLKESIVKSNNGTNSYKITTPKTLFKPDILDNEKTENKKKGANTGSFKKASVDNINIDCFHFIKNKDGIYIN